MKENERRRGGGWEGISKINSYESTPTDGWKSLRGRARYLKHFFRVSLKLHLLALRARTSLSLGPEASESLFS